VTDDGLDSGARQKPRQRGLTRDIEGEAREQLRSGEAMSTSVEPGHPSWKELMEEVVAPANVARAMKRVVWNQGSPGIDGMTVNELAAHWQQA